MCMNHTIAGRFSFRWAVIMGNPIGRASLWDVGPGKLYHLCRRGIGAIQLLFYIITVTRSNRHRRSPSGRRVVSQWFLCTGVRETNIRVLLKCGSYLMCGSAPVLSHNKSSGHGRLGGRQIATGRRVNVDADPRSGIWGGYGRRRAATP